MTDAAWDRGLLVTTAAAANAVSVADYTASMIHLCLKRVWQHALHLRERREWRKLDPGAGGYGSRVVLISLGQIGRRVAERLLRSDVRVIGHDLFPREDLTAAGVEYVGLEELFATLRRGEPAHAAVGQHDQHGRRGVAAIDEAGARRCSTPPAGGSSTTPPWPACWRIGRTCWRFLT